MERFNTWKDVFCEPNIDLKVECFNCLLLALFDKFAPLKRIKLGSKPHLWITDNIKLMMSLRDKALFRAWLIERKVHRDYYKQKLW